MVPRHVLALKRGVPVPLECAILNVPFGNTTVSTLLPGWSTPPAVNAPLAMMVDGALLAGFVFTSWKNSNPELPAPTWLALAAVRPVAASAPATATTLIAPKILLLRLNMVRTLPLTEIAQLGGRSCLVPENRPPSSRPPRRASQTGSHQTPRYVGATSLVAPLHVGRVSPAPG